ncbi:hydroxyacylglutathione hydrolase [Verrucomicrobiota bacterium]
MQVKIISSGDNYIYLIITGNTAAVVDPGSARSVLSAVRKFDVEISHVLITHNHFDHTGGCREIKAKTDCSIVGPGPSHDRAVSDGDIVAVGDCNVKVIAVPGHTHNDVAYYVSAEKMLFTGDTLFAGGCGRLFGGNADGMWNSLKKIMSLSDETLIYCGHDYALENLEFAAHLEPDNLEVLKRLEDVRQQGRADSPTVPSSLKLEKATNPFLRADTEAMKKAIGKPNASPSEVFAEIRRRKDQW